MYHCLSRLVLCFWVDQPFQSAAVGQPAAVALLFYCLHNLHFFWLNSLPCSTSEAYVEVSKPESS